MYVAREIRVEWGCCRWRWLVKFRARYLRVRGLAGPRRWFGCFGEEKIFYLYRKSNPIYTVVQPVVSHAIQAYPKDTKQKQMCTLFIEHRIGLKYNYVRAETTYYSTVFVKSHLLLLIIHAVLLCLWNFWYSVCYMFHSCWCCWFDSWVSIFGNERSLPLIRSFRSVSFVVDRPSSMNWTVVRVIAGLIAHVHGNCDAIIFSKAWNCDVLDVACIKYLTLHIQSV